MPRNWDAPGVYAEDVPALDRRIIALPTSVAAFVGRAAGGTDGGGSAVPVTVTSLAGYEQVFGARGSAYPMALAVRDYFANGGRRAQVLRLRAGQTGADALQPLADADYLGDAAGGTGLHALRDVSFNLLCVPPDRLDGDTTAVVWQAALERCVASRAMLLLDPPRGWRDARSAIASGTALFGLDGPDADHAALYFPRLWIRDPGGAGGVDACVPCGAVAGLFARNDAARGVWHSPAGIEATLPAVEAAVIAVGGNEGDRLQALSINCLRSFPSTGLVAWGARTLAAGDGIRYVSVRRLLLHVEASIAHGMAWLATAANDPGTWAVVRRVVEDFLGALHAQGAFPAPTRRDAFFVRCGHGTMTAADIDAGRLVIEAGVAPLRPGEYIIVRVVQQAMPATPVP